MRSAAAAECRDCRKMWLGNLVAPDYCDCREMWLHSVLTTEGHGGRFFLLLSFFLKSF